LAYIRKTKVFEGHRYEGCGKTEEEAYRKLFAKIEAAKRGELVTSKNMTVNTWANTWLDTYIAPRVREPGKKKSRGTMNEASYKSKEALVYNYIVPAIGTVKMNDVTPVMLQRVLNGNKEMSYSHVQKLKLAMEQMFRQAWVDKKILFDPAANLKLPAVEQKKRRALTDEERYYFFIAAQKNRHGLMFRFLLATGIRPNELAALRVGDISLKDKTVYVHSAVETGTSVIGMPKTDAGSRYTLINDLADKTIVGDLRAHIKGKTEEDFVFTAKDGKTMMSRAVLAKAWDSFARTMDLEMGAKTTRYGHIYDPSDLDEQGRPLYPDPKDKTKPRNGHVIAPDLVTYCLRHTFGTDMQRAGVPINQTRYMMGHTNISTTAFFYIDTGKADVLQVIDRLSEDNKA